MKQKQAILDVEVVENKKTGARRYIFRFCDIYIITKSPRERTEQQYLSVKVMEAKKYKKVKEYWNTDTPVRDVSKKTIIEVLQSSITLLNRSILAAEEDLIGQLRR